MADQQALRAEIDRLGRECGCGTGTVAAALAGLCYPLALIAGWTPPGHGSIPGTVAGVLGTVLLGALLGKAFGIAAARYRRSRLIRQLRSRP
ncbi:hypothetical protein [Nocardia sp. NPDC052566]|uniref:hypothetical protein n=1 Tax=Nocardia sp. NPDC052566 TaxID=3364330 RepID=UPI0037C91ACF